MEFLLTLINGLSLGGIYAMIALGYTMEKLLKMVKLIQLMVNASKN